MVLDVVGLKGTEARVEISHDGAQAPITTQHVRLEVDGASFLTIDLGPLGETESLVFRWRVHVGNMGLARFSFE